MRPSEQTFRRNDLMGTPGRCTSTNLDSHKHHLTKFLNALIQTNLFLREKVEFLVLIKLKPPLKLFVVFATYPFPLIMHLYICRDIFVPFKYQLKAHLRIGPKAFPSVSIKSLCR